MFEACVVGHVTKDIVIIGGKERVMPGGTACYTSIAMKSLGMNLAVVTKLSKDDEALLDDLKKNRIDIFVRESPATTTFTNIYGDDPNDRKQIVGGIAAPFTMADVEGIEARFFHLGPLTAGDITIELVQYLAARTKVSLDVQGFLRKIDRENGKVVTTEWAGKKEFLPFVSILKTSEDEARMLTGKEDIEAMAIELSAYGPKEVIITRGSNGSFIYDKSRFYRIPAFPPRQLIDPTGCGDTYMSGYLRLRAQSDNLQEVGEYAARAATRKLENYGPLRNI